MSEEKSEFAKWIAGALDQEVERLDELTRERLRQARAKALNSRVVSHAGPQRWMLPAGAALASLVAFVLWWGGGGNDRSPLRVEAPRAEPTDFEILTAKESLELYRNLDFYMWLEREAERAG